MYPHLQLGNPPAYYRESDPMPRKHTVWQQSSDFTGGQAPLHRLISSHTHTHVCVFNQDD